MFDNTGKLENKEIKKKIVSHIYTFGFHPTEKLADEILQQFWFHDFYNSFISDPIFLEQLINYLNVSRPKTFNKYKFYDFLFSQLVKSGKERRALQAIAVKFELRQSDTIAPEKYNKLDTENLWPIEKLQKLHLGQIGQREERNLYIWSHHTLTEFLTAEHILNQEDFLGAFAKLAILTQEGVTAFKPSWSGVLLFLLQSPKAYDILIWTLSFLEEHPENIDDNLSEIITLEKIDSDVVKDRIFHLIYGIYAIRLVWLPVWARKNLSELISQKSYELIKNGLKKTKNQIETFVKRGNAVAIADELLLNKKPLIDSKEKIFWKNKLIEFANNPDDGGNGVLQRHSLSALSRLKNPEIINRVADVCFNNNSDSLVRDEFIQMCYSTPESPEAIKYFIKGVKKGSDIYGRHGLYLLKSKSSIVTFLESVKSDDQFWKAFFRYENIYDKEEGDWLLIKNITNHIDKKVIELLKKILFYIFRIKDLYQEDRSPFIKKTVELILSNSPDFVFEVLEEIKTQSGEESSLFRFFDYEEIIALLLTPENVGQYYQEASRILPPDHSRKAESPIYIAKRINGEKGNSIYEKALELGLVIKVDEKYIQRTLGDDSKNRLRQIYIDFKSRLGIGKRYRTDLFSYYMTYKKEINELWTKDDKNKLIKYATKDGIGRIDPRTFKVSMPDKNTRQFKWSTLATYYGDILRVVNELLPDEINRHKQQIIDLIPYAFSDDLGTILDLVPKVTDQEMSFVNGVMVDKKDDRRYLVPGSYIHILRQYIEKGCPIISAKQVLLSFIGDKNISSYDQEAALETLQLLTNKTDIKTKEFLENIFKESENEELGKIANAFLITVYKDSEAINWRFEQLKKPIKFSRKEQFGVVHSVGPEEEEIDNLDLAKPLINLRDERYLEKFFSLLNFSFELLKSKEKNNEEKDYLDYVNYLWRIVMNYVDNLKNNNSFSPLIKTEDWIKNHLNIANINWLSARFREVRSKYINYFGAKS